MCVTYGDVADQENDKTYTGRLARKIDAAYEACKADEPGAQNRLHRAFLAQTRNIGRHKLRETYDDAVAQEAVHRAIHALKTFNGKSRLSTWFYRVALNEAFREQRMLLKKRDWEESINRPVH